MTVSQDDNVGFAFLQAAARRVHDLAIFNDSFRMTYGQLGDLAVALARGFQTRGIGRGATVAVRSDDVVAVLATIHATALVGARWMFATGPEELLARAGVTLLLDAGGEDGELLPGAVRLDAGWLAGPEAGAMAAPFPGYDDPDAPWILSQTSGTTGVPKIVALSHRVMSRRNRLYGHLFPRPGMRMTGLFHTGAIAQVMRYLSGLGHGATIMADPDPQAWWRHRVDLVFGSPNQVRQFVGETVLPGRLPLIYALGGAVPEPLIRHLLLSFEHVGNGYGSTECGFSFSIQHRLGEDGTLLSRMEPREGVTVEVVDAEDRRVEPGTEGILRVSGDVLAAGYLDDPELSARVFRDGWFYPGDLAQWTEDGLLRITGRINDQFNIGGVKINAAVLDEAIQRVAGVRDAVCFMVPTEAEGERLTAFVQLEPGAYESDVFPMIRIELMRLGSPNLIPKRILRADRIPRTPTGKHDRTACVAAVLEARAARRTGASAQ